MHGDGQQQGCAMTTTPLTVNRSEPCRECGCGLNQHPPVSGRPCAPPCPCPGYVRAQTGFRRLGRRPS